MLTSEGIIFLIFIAVLSGLTGYSFHRRDAVKKLLAVLLIMTVVFTGAMAESVLPADGIEAGLSSGEGIIFVATDRHAAYETVKASGEGTGEAEKSSEVGPPPEGEKPPEGKKPRRENRMPAYDENGNMIWHNHLTKVLKLVAADGVVPQLALIGGDFVGSGGDRGRDATGYPMGAPYFSMTAVDAQVQAVFGEKTDTLYTYGSHDKNAVDAYEEAFFSGPAACGGYYVYGISFAQMIYDTDRQAEVAKYSGKDREDKGGLSARQAAGLFLAWVKSLDDHLPILVMSHVPLHAHRGDNYGAWTWMQALNAAAEEHDVIFLWGHNHTTESGKDGREIERAHYLRLPGEPLTVQTWETDGEGKETGTRIRTTEAGEEIREPVTRTAPLRFVYLNAGYITNGVGTVLSFREGKMNVKRYFLDEEEKAEPWTYDLRFPPQRR